MRFLTLNLERYGAFTDRVLSFREDAPLHVVLGRNEAGKSTALSAIGDLLFGFPQTTDFAFLHEQTTLRVGAQIRLKSGETLTLRRRKGRKNTLFDDNDKPLDDELLAPALGAVPRKVFFSEFGLTAQALREGGRELLETGGRLAEMLAAASSRLSVLSQLRARLSEEVDNLFSPARRVASKPFYIAYDRYQATEKLLREKIVTTDAIAVAEAAVNAAQDERERLASKHDANGRELARLRRALRTQSKLRRLDSLRAELLCYSDLPVLEPASLARWRAAAEEASRIDEALDELRRAQASDSETIADLKVDERLLRQAVRIGELREAVGAVREAEKDLPGRHAEAREARDNLDTSAQRLGLRDHEELALRQPTEAQLALVEELIDRLGRAELKRAQASEAVDAARSKAQSQDEAAERGVRAVDPARFQQLLDLHADVPALADRRQRDALTHRAARRLLEEEASRLEPRIGGIDALALAPAPDAAKIEAARQQLEALQSDEKRAAIESAAAHDALTEAEQEIVSLQLEGEVATREDLRGARAARENAYDDLSAVLDTDAASKRRVAFEALGAANRKVDATTDLLLTGADRAARYAAACERRARLQREYENMRGAQDERLARWETFRENWRRLWAASGIEPLTPLEMIEWRRKATDILQRRDRLDAGRLDLDVLSQTLEAKGASLQRLIEDMRTDADPALPLESAYRLAQTTLDKMQTSWTQARSAALLKDAAMKDLARAEHNLLKAQEELERSASGWPDAIRAIGLESGALPAQAKANLREWRSIPLHRERLRTAQHRIAGMEKSISDFEMAVASLIASVAPDIDGQSPRSALNAMNERLLKTQADNERRETMREAARKREAARVQLMGRRDAATATLAAAFEAFALAPNEALGLALERADRRNAYAAELDACLHDLAESSDGRDETALRAEQTDLQPELLPGAIARLEIDGKEILADIEGAAAALHDASRRRDELMRGRGAASVASEKTEAAAELGSIARRWLLRASAAKLAALAIERHRATMEDPLIARASKLFAVATDSGFAGLCADYDEDGSPTLKGLRASGARVAIARMSEGTRDQLFLALRLALLELRGGEPLPFIGDDLLASFDELRTARALELLAEFGKTRQAIVFTHHRHVAEIAVKLAVAADIIEL